MQEIACSFLVTLAGKLHWGNDTINIRVCHDETGKKVSLLIFVLFELVFSMMSRLIVGSEDYPTSPKVKLVLTSFL